MNAKSFFGKIREIIREEIEYALENKINEQKHLPLGPCGKGLVGTRAG